MSDHLEEEDQSASSGMDRRTFVRRGAILGGMVWAAPAISTMGSRAFAQTEGTPRECHDISYLALVIKNGSPTYQFKLNAGGSVEMNNPMEAPHCTDPTGWNASGNIGGYPSGTTWDITSDPCCWTVTIPSGYSLVGVAMGAGGDKTPQGYCVSNPTVSTDGRTYKFCAPAK
jgi:hypothetical protein